MKLVLPFILVLSSVLCAQVKPSPKVLPQAAAPTAVNLGLVSRCPQTTPAILMWSGTGFFCANLGSGLSLGTNGVLNAAVAAPVTPQWTVETISLASLTAGATGVSYQTTKTPINGVVFFSYISTFLGNSSAGAVLYTGNPLQLTLPPIWQNCTIAPVPVPCTADLLTITYQWQ